MSTRIIIEKDGERYVANDLIPNFVNDGKPFCITNKETDEYVSSTFTQLPPVIRTDNSEVIARLERGIERRDAQIRVLQRENAKLREALKPIMECDIGLTDSVYAISTAKSIMKGISRKDEDISRKGEKK